MLKINRWCRRCRAARSWSKIRPPGGKVSRRICSVCGGITTRIKGRRKRDVMPYGLFGYREKVKVADELWRRWVYAKAPDGACAVCHRVRGLQAMHIFSRGAHPALRHDPDNGAPGCQGCHNRLGRAHEEHRDFCIRFLGPERYERLRLRSISRAKGNVDLSIIELTQLLSQVPPVWSQSSDGSAERFPT
jgi:hypothetical protein